VPLLLGQQRGTLLLLLLLDGDQFVTLAARRIGKFLWMAGSCGRI
jgi:hypothetical protein